MQKFRGKIERREKADKCKDCGGGQGKREAVADGEEKQEGPRSEV